MPRHPMFIDGEWVDAADRTTITDPATEDPVATLASGGVAETDAAVSAARAAHERGADVHRRSRRRP